MPDTLSSRSQQTRPGARVSLACVACRTKHLRCDADLPTCSRCRLEKKECNYQKSRRGGRRRPRTVLTSTTQETSPSQPEISWPEVSMITLEPSLSRNDTTDSRTRTSSSEGGVEDVVADQLLSLYYTFFHTAHPCVLPRKKFKQYLITDGEALHPLYTVLQYIGSLFQPLVSSESCQNKTEEVLTAVRQRRTAVTGYDVQAFLLYSIALYWCDEIERGLSLLDEAISMALNIKMNRSHFATNNGRRDPVLEESWRRTWWQIYVTDAHSAGSTHTFPFRTSHIEMDVHLPCEEEMYEVGSIPQPRSLEEYDIREFMADEDQNFSSFAELIGLTRSLDLALASRRNLDIETTTVVAANVDASVMAWKSLLPDSKKGIVRFDGSIDELIFRSHEVIYTYMVDCHRQLSTLSYNPVEATSKCSPPAPPECLRGCDTPECKIHTIKVLQAIKGFDELLTMPTRVVTHTPFTICMIAVVTIAHLAACRYHYQGQDLQLGRERIRLSMGVLKSLGAYWPAGRRTYREVGIIARDVLSLKLPQSLQASLTREAGDFQFEMSSMDFPATHLFDADNSLELCDFLDSNFHGESERSMLFSV